MKPGQEYKTDHWSKRQSPEKNQNIHRKYCKLKIAFKSVDKG